jgi:hypothetical protein
VWTDAQLAKQGRRDDGVNGSRVHQEIELNCTLRLCGVGNVQLDVGQAHTEPRDSSGVRVGRGVKQRLSLERLASGSLAAEQKGLWIGALPANLE